MADYIDHVKNIEDDYWANRFPEYKRWQNMAWSTYQKYGYISVATGFNCGGVMTRNKVFNYSVQGPAFHCLLWSLIEIDRIAIKENWDTKIIGQIHDAIVFDTNPDELDHVMEVVKRVTCEDLPDAWNWIITPLDIELDVFPVDGSWADKIKN